MRQYVFAIFAITACTTPPAEPEASQATGELGSSCTLQCSNAQLQCEATCERFPRPSCEENCDTRFDNCMHACGCPFTEEIDRTSFDHADATASFLCVGSFPNPGKRYQVYNFFDRTDHVRRTLQCDGSTTETVLSSTVTAAGQCTHKLFPDQTCPQATISPNGLCTF